MKRGVGSVNPMQEFKLDQTGGSVRLDGMFVSPSGLLDFVHFSTGK